MASHPHGRIPAGERQRTRWIMDFFFFFAGLFSTIAALAVIKKTSPNLH
jgi:hypothetical protein